MCKSLGNENSSPPENGSTANASSNSSVNEEEETNMKKDIKTARIKDYVFCVGSQNVTNMLQIFSNIWRINE